MSDMTNREKAYNGAAELVLSGRMEVDQLFIKAQEILAFLEATTSPSKESTAATPPTESASTSATKPRKPKPAPSAVTAPTAPSSCAATEATMTSASASAPTAAATSGSDPVVKVPLSAVKEAAVELTDSDVRTALVQAQTRLGGREKPQAVLAKYATPATMQGLKKEDYPKVIKECAALS